MADHSSPDIVTAPPADLAERIALYLEDMPSDGQHSDAAGANCWELLEEAMNELLAIKRAAAGLNVKRVDPAPLHTRQDVAE